MTLRLSLFCILFAVCMTANATSIQGLSFKQLSQNAELVFEGEVLAVESKWNDRKSAITTRVTFEVKDIVVGEFNESTLSLDFLGGSVDGETMQVESLIYPKLGEHGIYFVESTTQRLVNPLLGWTQGHYKIKEGQMATNTDRLISSMGDGEEVPVGTVNDGPANGIRTKILPYQPGVSVDEFKSAIMKAKQ